MLSDLFLDQNPSKAKTIILRFRAYFLFSETRKSECKHAWPFWQPSRCTESPFCCETIDPVYQPLCHMAGLAGSEGNSWRWEGEKSLGGDWSNGVGRAREVSLRWGCGAAFSWT